MSVIVYLVLSPLLLVLSLIFYRFEPRKINPYYGYRTRRSMASQHNWKIANEYSCRILVGLSVVLNSIQALAYILLSDQVAFLLVACLMVLGLIAIIPLTESHLKKFGDQ